jgi:hypothetical protein
VIAGQGHTPILKELLAIDPTARQTLAFRPGRRALVARGSMPRAAALGRCKRVAIDP